MLVKHTKITTSKETDYTESLPKIEEMIAFNRSFIAIESVHVRRRLNSDKNT